jgi:hypothetical protein
MTERSAVKGGSLAEYTKVASLSLCSASACEFVFLCVYAYVCVCVSVCACACVCACVSVCVCTCYIYWVHLGCKSYQDYYSIRPGPERRNHRIQGFHRDCQASTMTVRVPIETVRAP